MPHPPRPLSEFVTPDALKLLISAAIAEDVGPGDITTRGCLGREYSHIIRASLLIKSNGVLAGEEIFAEVFSQVDPQVIVESNANDGDTVSAGDIVANIRGPRGPILTAERTALNFMGRLSGIASLTATFVSAVSHTKTKILDTRKTTPGWRALEKYAVTCGGGVNHRRGLYDMALIKDNHIAAAGSITNAVGSLRAFIESDECTKQFGADSLNTVIEVEVRNEQELREALQANITRLLFDNCTVNELRRLVSITKNLSPDVITEASGNMNLQSVADYAASGVDYISVGALTHSAPCLDMSLDVAR